MRHGDEEALVFVALSLLWLALLVDTLVLCYRQVSGCRRMCD